MPLDVDPTPIRGAWFRHVPAGGEPLFRPQRPADGRWQRGDIVEGFYLADHEETAWAEWYRALAEFAIPPMRQLPRDLWRFNVAIASVADLSSLERLERVDLPPPVPNRMQWDSFQAVGERLFADGWAGILYPPAARPESLALCLFRTADELHGVRPRRHPSRHDEPPAPPTGLRA